MMDDKTVRISMINIPMPVANTDYPDGGWLLPRNCKWFRIQCREATEIRIATESGKAASSEKPYWTLSSREKWAEDNLDIQGDEIFYFACGNGGKTVQIIVGLKRTQEEEMREA